MLFILQYCNERLYNLEQLCRYTDQLGQLWNSLADYYIRSGLFERARDIYEEAIQTVTTVRDFTQVSFLLGLANKHCSEITI